MKLMILLLLVTLSGCMPSRVPQPLEPRLVALQASPDEAYQRALTTMEGMGYVITFADPRTRILSATVPGAVALQVGVVPRPDDVAVYVKGSLLPGNRASGSVTAVDDYAKRLQQ